jgi:hypothetical protein
MLHTATTFQNAPVIADAWRLVRCFWPPAWRVSRLPQLALSARPTSCSPWPTTSNTSQQAAARIFWKRGKPSKFCEHGGNLELQVITRSSVQLTTLCYTGDGVDGRRQFSMFRGAIGQCLVRLFVVKAGPQVTSP